MRQEGGGGPGRGERSWVGGWQSCLSPGFYPRVVSGSKWPGTSSAQSEKSAGAGVKDPQINKLQSWRGRQTRKRQSKVQAWGTRFQMSQERLVGGNPE